MPFLPENRKRYPKDWKQVSHDVKTKARWACEFCGKRHGMPLNNKGASVILTVAHLDHQPENCDPENLKALCQTCHNGYDAEHRAKTRNRRKHGDTSKQPTLFQ